MAVDGFLRGGRGEGVAVRAVADYLSYSKSVRRGSVQTRS
jgi:hypothetical protein